MLLIRGSQNKLQVHINSIKQIYYFFNLILQIISMGKKKGGGKKGGKKGKKGGKKKEVQMSAKEAILAYQ